MILGSHQPDFAPYPGFFYKLYMSDVFVLSDDVAYSNSEMHKYNYIRFGDPFEFGHTYLPEFQRAEHGQFSLVYFWPNFKAVFCGLPIFYDGNKVYLSCDGFSMFFSCPILLLQSVWIVSDIRNRQMSAAKWVLLLCESMNLFALLLHRTIGGFQFGFRYAIELIPYAFAWFLEDPRRQKLPLWEWCVLFWGLVLNFNGGMLIHV